MASTKLMETKDGKKFYRIFVSKGRNQPRYSTRWYIPEGWSQTSIDRGLQKAVREFESKCLSGEVLCRAEIKQREAAEAAEAAKLKTVRQYANGVFMPTKEATFSENSKSSYRMNLEKHVFPVIGDSLLIEVTPAMIQKLLIDFQKAGHAHSSVVKLYNIINGVFEMAFLDDSIKMNPMLKVKRPAPRKDEKKKEESEKAYTAKELQYILSCAAQEPLKWQTFISLMADTGARRGEMCGLYWQDIDWKSSTITIRRNLQYTSAAGVYECTPKNGKSRTVDIGADTLSLLKRLRQEQSETCISKYVFTEDTAEPIWPQSPTLYFKRFGKRYGIKDFHPHKLRHSSASIAITLGADVVSVSQRLGHSDTAVTLRMYAHANEESIRKAGQIVRDALKAENG